MAFPLFSNFPLELQLAIWALSIPDPEPEVCIAWPLTLYDWEDEQPAQPFTVDTSWPAAAHVCRTARAAVLSPSLIRLRHSPTANLAVPFRTFNPAIDTLYWCHNQKSSMRTFLQAPQNQPLALALRHLAISIRATYPLSDITELIHQHATDLHTLSLVVPDSSPTQPVHATFLPPARRCRLADIPLEVARGITLTDVPFLPAPLVTIRSTPLSAYLGDCRREMDVHVRWHVIPRVGEGRGGTAWTPAAAGGGEGSFGGLVIKAQTFVEFRPTAAADGGSRGGRWVEVCGRRLLGRDGRAPEARRVVSVDAGGVGLDPEEYRVLDFDCGWYGMDEFQGAAAGGGGVRQEYGTELGLGRGR
jgi:hypothetical protein